MEVNTPPAPPKTPPATRFPPAHHMPPRTIPSAPPTPQPAPNPGPIGPGVIVVVGVIISSIRCPLGSYQRATRSKNDFEPRVSPRRQRPCSGQGDPIVEYRDRRRKIGYFKINKLIASAKKGSLQGEVDKNTKKIAERAGYKVGSGRVRIESELTGPQGVDKLAALLGGSGELCYYNVFAIEKRRVCKCPDGSPCRRTTRDD